MSSDILKYQMPATFYLTCQLDQSAPRDPEVGLHAAVHHLIEETDLALARDLHGANLNPLSLGLARHGGFGGVLGADRRTLQFRLNLLDEGLLPALQEAFATGAPLTARPDRQRLVGQVIGMHVLTTPYAALREQDAVSTATLTFLSPAVLRAGDAYINRPASRVLMHGLLRRWNAFAPDPMPEASWDWVDRGAVTLHEAVERDEVRWPKGGRNFMVPAFTGTATYALPAGEAGETLAALCLLANWSGIGAKTLFGFGETFTRLAGPGDPGS